MSKDRQDDERKSVLHNTGRVVFDDRGNSIWEWDESKRPALTSEGELSDAVIPDLEIEGAREEAEKEAEDQFNPYNSDPSVRSRKLELSIEPAPDLKPDKPLPESGDEKEELFNHLMERSRSRRS